MFTTNDFLPRNAASVAAKDWAQRCLPENTGGVGSKVTVLFRQELPIVHQKSEKIRNSWLRRNPDFEERRPPRLLLMEPIRNFKLAKDNRDSRTSAFSFVPEAWLSVRVANYQGAGKRLVAGAEQFKENVCSFDRSPNHRVCRGRWPVGQGFATNLQELDQPVRFVHALSWRATRPRGPTVDHRPR